MVMTLANNRSFQIFKWVGLALSLVGVVACSEAIDLGQISHSASSVVSEASIPPGDATTHLLSQTAEALVFTLCFESATWRRPSVENQLAQLEAMPRYGSAIYQEPLKSVFDGFVAYEVVSFTSYGLSARLEPLYFSGLGTVEADVLGCYDGNQPEAINNGETLELWVMNHRVEAIGWTGDRYRVTASPTDGGMQVIFVPRREQSLSPLIEVVTPEQVLIPSTSGDWQP